MKSSEMFKIATTKNIIEIKLEGWVSAGGIFDVTERKFKNRASHNQQKVSN